jgi:hypothetical protein
MATTPLFQKLPDGTFQLTGFLTNNVFTWARDYTGPRKRPVIHVQAPPTPRPRYHDASQAALACKGCGFISCRCQIAAPPKTMDLVIAQQRQQGRR